MMNAEIKLESKLVGSIKGKFFVPSYQRGYRWGKEDVTRLLDDIYSNNTSNYCLQPVVVKKNGDSYELVDGQQRLTTLYLIYQYMHKASGGFMDAPKFSLEYRTRGATESFLVDIDPAMKDVDADLWFICDAYETIEKWFIEKDKKSALTNINKYFDENVKIIWYEVDKSEDSIALFTRLNIGKIPLTSAELVKAIFLSRDTNQRMTQERQEEISLQWDNIEKELHNSVLWSFLSNHKKHTFQTRVDLILNLISGKPETSKDKYYTFFYFDELSIKESLEEIWRTIQHTFLILKDWFENHELYHKVGYLIASEHKTLQSLFDSSKDKTKAQFRIKLDEAIKESISSISKNYAELNYENANDYKHISRLLLLFNVESVRRNGDQTQWFPFDKFKFEDGRKVKWSLEHIHAQQSESIQKQEVWREWLSLHIPSIKSLGDDNAALLSEMQNACNKDKLDRQEFEAIQALVVEKLSAQGNTEYLHSIANLALLNTSDNAALNNSTFDVKRNAIIQMDKQGQYIPFCTKMVFLKYYTSESNQLHFWGQADRIAYVKAINTVLKDYLKEVVQTESEVM
jgi:hypothetical protein